MGKSSTLFLEALGASWLVILPLLLGACSPKSEQLQRLILEKQYAEAHADGVEWLKEADEETRKTSEARKVFFFTAQARLLDAIALRDVKALRAFRADYAHQKMLSKLLDFALENEASFYYQQVTLNSNTVDAHKVFKRHYPNAKEALDSRRREVELAFKDAEIQGDQRAWVAFQESYHGWTEAASFIPRARRAEASYVYEHTLRDSHDPAALEAFRLKYPDADEAPEALRREARLRLDAIDRAPSVAAYRAYVVTYTPLEGAAPFVKEAHEKEVRHAIKNANVVKTAEAYQALRDTYTTPRWREAIDLAELHAHLDPLLERARERHPLDPSETRRFIQRFARHPNLDVEAKGARALIEEALKGRTDLWLSRLARALFEDLERDGAALEREAAMAWAEVKQARKIHLLADFFEWYPSDARADEAEAGYYKAAQAYTRRYAWPQAKIERRDVEGQRQTLTFSVQDCEGTRISGLTKTAFTIRDLFGAPLDFSFKGMEDDRPLDVAFLIDMSGSMATEIDAVRQATSYFASTFQFRNREARFGLIGFSDLLEPKHRFTAKINTFTSWLMALTNLSGAEEDTAGAIAQGLEYFKRSGGHERVSILFSDEPLQINIEGGGLLKQAMPARCKSVVGIIKCFQERRCEAKESVTQIKTCAADCVLKHAPEAKRLFTRCLQHMRHRRWGDPRARCKANLNLRNYVTVGGCHERVDVRSKTMTALIQQINAARMRGFYFVPIQSDQSGFREFQHLANQTQGRVIDVPPDAKQARPYIDALISIADQLSKQYVISYKTQKNKMNNKMMFDIASIEVSRRYVWNFVESLPQSHALALFELKRSGCPLRFIFNLDGSIFIKDGCEAPWALAALKLTRLKKIISLSISRKLLLTEDGTLSILELDQIEAGLRPLMTGVLDLTLLDDTLLALTGDTIQRSRVDRQRPGPWRAHPLPVTLDASTPYIFFAARRAHQPIACVQVDPKIVYCNPLREAPIWYEHSSHGLGFAAFDHTDRVIFNAARPDVLLLIGHDERVYRTIDGGRHWSPVAQGRYVSASSIPGLISVASCLSSHEGVICSEDAGRTWFDVAGPFEKSGPTTIITLDERLYAIINGQLMRLDHLVTRDLPSSEIFFDTNKDITLSTLTPFLHTISQQMALDPALRLRIEGHADKRGEEDANEDLARRRAENVAAGLHGVALSRVEVRSYGERRPIREGNSAKDLARNRRVELILSRPAPSGGWAADRCGAWSTQDPMGHRAHFEAL